MGCVMSKAKLQIFSINVSLMKIYIPINSVKIKKQCRLIKIIVILHNIILFYWHCFISTVLLGTVDSHVNFSSLENWISVLIPCC